MQVPAALWMKYGPEQTPDDTWIVLMIYTWETLRSFQVMKMAEYNCIIKWLMQKAEFKDILEVILKATMAKHVI